MNKILIPLIGCLALVLILLTFRPGQAQQESATYFPETGHYVDEPFLSRLQAEGGTHLWGPPITEAFEGSGRYVAIATKGASRSTTRLVGWDVIYDVGGPML